MAMTLYLIRLARGIPCCYGTQLMSVYIFLHNTVLQFLISSIHFLHLLSRYSFTSLTFIYTLLYVPQMDLQSAKTQLRCGYCLYCRLLTTRKSHGKPLYWT